MTTEYVYKVLAIYPAADLAAINAFVGTAFPNFGTVTANISPDGSSNYTHGAVCFHATKAQATVWVNRLATRLSLPAPTGFVDWDRAEQTAWLLAANALLVPLGSYFEVVFNDEGTSHNLNLAWTTMNLWPKQTLSQSVHVAPEIKP